MKNTVKYWFGPLFHLFFPRCCAVCGAALIEGEDTICTRCNIDMPLSLIHISSGVTLTVKLYLWPGSPGLEGLNPSPPSCPHAAMLQRAMNRLSIYFMDVLFLFGYHNFKCLFTDGYDVEARCDGEGD